MAEWMSEVPMRERVEKYGFMKRYNGPLKLEPEDSAVKKESGHIPVYLELSKQEKQAARFDTDRYLLTRYYRAPIAGGVPALNEAEVEQLKDLGIKMVRPALSNYVFRFYSCDGHCIWVSVSLFPGVKNLQIM